MFKSISRRAILLALTLSAFLGGMTATQLAQAGCAVQPAVSPPAQQSTAPVSTGKFSDAVFRPGRTDAAHALQVNFIEPPSVVGTWKFEMISDGSSADGPPSGVVIDFGLQQWHGDGTEEMISAGRRPGVGDVCMGSWERTGAWTYHLNHYALGWETNPPNTGPIDSANYVGPTHIVVDVIMGPNGRSFTGNFKLTVYATTVSDPFDEHTQIAFIRGTVRATRVTADGR